jgi:hypothetical protein
MAEDRLKNGGITDLWDPNPSPTNPNNPVVIFLTFADDLVIFFKFAQGITTCIK